MNKDAFRKMIGETSPEDVIHIIKSSQKTLDMFEGRPNYQILLSVSLALAASFAESNMPEEAMKMALDMVRSGTIAAAKQEIKQKTFN
jgi:hypothetical protein